MIIEDTLGEEGDYETVRNIHETLNDLIEEHKEEPEPLALDMTEMKKVFEQSGVDAEKMETLNAILRKMREKRQRFWHQISQRRRNSILRRRMW